MAVIFLLCALQSAGAVPHVITTGTLPRRMVESSGVAVSRAHPGLLWTHNDSGDDAYVYATDLAGTDRGTVRIRGAKAVDWEDITLAPCPAGRTTCLYIADTGDNERRRNFVVIYAVPEPAPPGKGRTTRSARTAALRLKYSGGPDDVEAIYVGPRDGAVYLVSKGRRGAIRLYQIPRNAWERGSDTTITVSPLQELPITPFAALGKLVTGAAMRRDGRLVAVRTYTDIYFFVPGADGRLAPSRAPVCTITGLEVQGEAVDFLDDSTLVLTSEGSERKPASVHSVRCPT